MTGARAKQASERSRHPTEVRRHLIVKAARSVIAERGLFATSVGGFLRKSSRSLPAVNDPPAPYKMTTRIPSSSTA